MVDPKPSPSASPSPLDPPEARALRSALVAKIGELRTPRVRRAMLAVPRHLFAAGHTLEQAYADHPLSIGYEQTISQPTVVVMMTEALELEGTERVLEIGTGSGYQAAILGLCAREVDTIELVAPLAERAEVLLAELGHANVHVRVGDGYAGWPERAPFDRVIVTAAPPALPAALVEQLAEGGILVAPVGAEDGAQSLLRHRKIAGRLTREDLGPVRFVPMVPGDARRG